MALRHRMHILRRAQDDNSLLSYPVKSPRIKSWGREVPDGRSFVCGSAKYSAASRVKANQTLRHSHEGRAQTTSPGLLMTILLLFTSPVASWMCYI